MPLHTEWYIPSAPCFKNQRLTFHITNNRALRSWVVFSGQAMQLQAHFFATRDESMRALEAVMLKDDFRSAR